MDFAGATQLMTMPWGVILDCPGEPLSVGGKRVGGRRRCEAGAEELPLLDRNVSDL